MASTNTTKEELRQYLLGLLSNDAEESIELRLVTDTAIAEEFDIVVDEITDEYLANTLEPQDRMRVERYFLAANQRKDKLKFASSLADYASSQSNSKPAESKESVWESFRNLVRIPSWALAMGGVVVLAIVVSTIFLTTNRNQTLQAVALNLTSGTRGSNEESQPVKLEPNVDALKFSLQLPSGESQAVNYKVQLVRPDGTTEPVAVSEHDRNAVVVVIKSAEFTAGSYALQVSIVDSDSTEHRIQGSYLFTVQ